MKRSNIRFSSFPRTEPPPRFVVDVIGVFQQHEQRISTSELDKGLTSNQVLQVLRPDLERLGFKVESGKSKAEKIQRPVFFGEDGNPTLNPDFK